MNIDRIKIQRVIENGFKLQREFGEIPLNILVYNMKELGYSKDETIATVAHMIKKEIFENVSCGYYKISL